MNSALANDDFCLKWRSVILQNRFMISLPCRPGCMEADLGQILTEPVKNL